MRGIAFCGVVICGMLALGLVGCNKSANSSSSGAGAGGAAGSATPIDPAGVVGKWRVTNVQASDTAAAQMGETLNDLEHARLTLNGDKTFRMWDGAAGGSGGTWSVTGSSLTLVDSASGHVDTLAMQGSQLTNAGVWDSTVVFYDRLGDGADEPKYQMTADAFLAKGKKDEAGYKSDYWGNCVEIEGVVNEVRTSKSGDVTIRVYGPATGGNRKSSPDEFVVCYPANSQVYAHLAAGQKVKLRGVAGLTFDNPVLAEAEVVGP